MRLEGRVAVVTGGAQGIGAAIARAYAEEGARVVVADIAEDAARALAEDIGGGAMGLRLDVADRASIDAAMAEVAARHGTLDILVNNAAVFDMGPFLDVTEESYDRLFAVNVKGLLFTMQAGARAMLAQGPRPEGRRGKVVNMASQAGRRGEALVAVYCATKAAVISLTQSAGLALAREGINVNGIAPGVVDTPMWDTVDALFAREEGKPLGQKKREVGLAVPMGRMGRPGDYRGAAVFLASPESDYVVAQTLNVDGGNWMS